MRVFPIVASGKVKSIPVLSTIIIILLEPHNERITCSVFRCDI